VSALATIRETPGLSAYLDELEEHLQATVRSHGGLASPSSSSTWRRSSTTT
jgi:hypothetical protein